MIVVYRLRSNGIKFDATSKKFTMGVPQWWSMKENLVPCELNGKGLTHWKAFLPLQKYEWPHHWAKFKPENQGIMNHF